MRLASKGEPIFEQLAEKDQGDDLERVAIVAEAEVGADGLEVINEDVGFCFEEAGGVRWSVSSDASERVTGRTLSKARTAEEKRCDS